jgi:predicted nucleic acid-binding protein
MTFKTITVDVEAYELLREAKRGIAGPATKKLEELADEELAERYGALLATLDRQGETVATTDLLIAATALADGARLVTRNGRHFGRIPGLEVVTY